MNRSSLIVLAVLVLSSAGFGILQLDKVKKLTEGAAAWDSERAALQKRILDLQKRNGELERRRAAIAVAPVPRGEDRTGAEEERRNIPRGPAGPEIRTRNEAGRFGAMLANPEMQKLMAIQQKSALDGHYSSLFKQLKLSPADLEKFKDLLIQKNSTVMDVMAAARSEGLSGRENRDQIRDLVQSAQAEVDDSIRSTLGDAAYSQYQNYEVTQPQRNLVSQLEQRLSYSSAPLTDSQSQQLVQILAETSPTKNNGGRNAGSAGLVSVLGLGGPGGPTAFFGGPTITADAITRSQGVLSTEQVSALQSLQQEQQASALLRQQMRAKGAGTSPATLVNQTTSTRSISTPGK